MPSEYVCQKFSIIISKLNIQAQKHRIVLVAVSFCFRIVRFVLLRSTVKFSFMSNKKCVEQRRSVVLFFICFYRIFTFNSINLRFHSFYFIFHHPRSTELFLFIMRLFCISLYLVCVCVRVWSRSTKKTEKRESKYKQVNKTKTPKLFAGRTQTQTKYDMAQKLLHHFFTYCTCIVRW